MEKATLGGGCFWCIDAVFGELRGVEGVVSGYAGGHVADPTYRDVCAGITGHAEVVQVTFDPEVVAYGDLLDVFFTVHDPTQLNRQGADVGEQYRSVILAHDDAQRAVAEAKIADLERAGVWGSPIVTTVEPFSAFYPAGDEHQDYYRRQPFQPYCQAVIRPKVAKLRAAHLDKLRKDA